MKKTSLAGQSSLQSGFSLVELSIVLAVLGLLIGGIMAGQSIIAGAKLRTISTEYERYESAITTFRGQYNAAPGDFRNATKFWGKDTAYCNADSGTGATPGTCNGNGNGYINNPPAASQSGEMFRFWQQLSLAGLLEGKYTGVAGPAISFDTIFNQNAPASKFGDSGWQVFTFIDMPSGGNAYYTSDHGFFASDYGNSMIFANRMGSVGDWEPVPILTPTEAWNIDKKMDDGKPGTGRMLSYWPDCTKATNHTDFSANYAVDSNEKSCVAIFTKVF